MASRTGSARAASESVQAVQADAIAWAALEDVLLKLSMDTKFPPGYPRPDDQNF